MAPSNTENGNALDLSDNSLSPQELARMFSHVPWVEFNVTAKANLTTFTGNPAVRHVITQVAQATVKNITAKLVEDLTDKFKKALDQAIADSTNAVAAHITDNMNQLFKGLEVNAKARPFTKFQPLQDEDDLDNDPANKNLADQNVGGTPGSNGTAGSPAGPMRDVPRTLSAGDNTGNIINGGVGGTNSGSFNPNSNNNNNNIGPNANNTPSGTPAVPTTPGGTEIDINNSNSGNIINGSVSGTNTDSFNPNSNNNNNNTNTNPNPPLDVTKPAITAPDLANGSWIWTTELPYDNPPQAPRGFRKTLNIPGGTVDSLIIDITCDNFQTVYVNGACLGYGLDLVQAKRWSVTFPPTNKVVIAVYAANDPISKNVAGLIAAAVTWNSKEFTGRTYEAKTDASWKCITTTPPKGFEATNFNDRSWGGVRIVGPFGSGPAPWTAVVKPTKAEAITDGYKSAQVNGLPDAPKAPLAIPGPNIDGSTEL